ncbi:YqgE/AlgH family protein [Oceanicoccus sp. KOV_DT_Chl]|uniref:YqgE/AlgH family protein n=1 Tax=Oceanicoccus sp. KOV_DT_Chl TaxID=1904639 RepID=UPI000C7CCF84|nr:YqgE/AlgH family protein [Oceanicoccus sp. KOV_DT_Chl]
MDKLSSANSLKDHFLIAMPTITDGLFANSITYICEHNDQGAMGIVINHPLDLSLDEIFQHLEINDIQGPHSDQILAGGPVHMDRGFVLHRTTEQEWDSTIRISGQVALTTSQDILTAIAHDQGPVDSIVALGYAGWSAGQLEIELADNAWLTVPADSDIIFNTPVELRAKAAAAQMGVDLALISPQAGHA